MCGSGRVLHGVGGKPPGASHVGSSMQNGRPPDPAERTVMDVNYFRAAGFEEQASAS